MSPAGDELVARWREEGEWWEGESPREIDRYLDANGHLREEETPVVRPEPNFDAPENYWFRRWRMRDDKVAHANGYSIQEAYVESAPALPRKPYALLHVQSGHAYGRSTLIVDSVPNHTEARAYWSVLLADPFSLAGAHEFLTRCKAQRIKPLIGAAFEMAEGGELVLVARTKRGYRNLSRLITACHLEEPRLFPLCTWERLERYAEDLLCLTGGDLGPVNRMLIRGDDDQAQAFLDRVLGLYGRENVFVQIERSFLPWETGVNRRLLELAERRGVVPVAGGPITHRRPEHFPAQDMLVCVETLCLIEEVVGRKALRDLSQPGIRQPPRRALNAERYLRTPDELDVLFSDCPYLVENTIRVAERCAVNVLPLRTELPKLYEDENGFLEHQVWQMAARLPDRTRRRKRLWMELNCITHHHFAGHFLVAWDMCRWAQGQGIVFSGRGSVVDSAVAYCLGLSRIDAFEQGLHFDRFLPIDGKKRPDIDIDFEANRRDDVRDYLVRKYGDAHVATVGAVGTYGTRGIVREVGKVMGIPQENLDYLAKRLHGSVTPERLEEEIDKKPELRDSGIPRERFRWVFRLAELLMEVPRNLRAHSSGVVISRDPIADTVPVTYSGVEGVKIIQWDKRSCKDYFDKFDVLCLRGNDVLASTQQRVRAQTPEFSVEAIPLTDERVFETMRQGDLIGIPQSASPAMRQAHIRLKTEHLKDAGIVQAAIRPGVGGAVKLNELVARRNKKPFEYIHPDLKEILEPTLGIIVFQEQVDKLLEHFGGYSSGEAEVIREDIYKKRREEHVKTLREQVIARIMAKDYPRHVAEEVYGLVAQFQGYGFAEGHALAFADISIRSIWCQQNYPAEFFAALLDAQPAGYYGPATIANEARIRQVKVLPPCVNRSDLKYKVETVRAEEEPKILIPNRAIRVALSQFKDISKQTLARTVEERERGRFDSFFDYVARVRPARDELERFILGGLFDDLCPNRRALLWAIPSALQYAASIAAGSSLGLSTPQPLLPEGVRDFSPEQKAVYERRFLDLDVERHLMAFERERVEAKGVTTAQAAGRLSSKTRAVVVGNPIRLRFPPTSSGMRVFFFDLEDETGLLNVTCFNETYLRDGHAVICNPYITVWGEAQNRDGHIAFLASRIYPYRPLIDEERLDEEALPITTGDFLMK